jgi:hypothetical protein
VNWTEKKVSPTIGARGNPTARINVAPAAIAGRVFTIVHLVLLIYGIPTKYVYILYGGHNKRAVGTALGRY